MSSPLESVKMYDAISDLALQVNELKSMVTEVTDLK